MCLWETFKQYSGGKRSIRSDSRDKTPQTGFQRYAVFNYCAVINIIAVSIQCSRKAILVLSIFREVWVRMQSTPLVKVA